MSSDVAIEVLGLCKSFKDVCAVDEVSVSVKKGEVFGFLGPNGAGKTTSMKSILGLIHPDAGSIHICGVDALVDPKNARAVVGYMPERVALYQNLSAIQNMELFADVKGVSREECIGLINEMGLEDAMKRRVSGFSKGMLQRLGLARALIGSPEVLVLDEPTGGLDPRGVKEIRDRILSLKERGVTVLLSSHILSEVQAVCDRVGVIDEGHLVAVDSVKNLSSSLQMMPRLICEIQGMSEGIIAAVKSIEDIGGVSSKGCMLSVECPHRMMALVIKTILDAGGDVVEMRTMEPSLEDVFMRLTSGGSEVVQ